ncbi:MAG: HAD hydrolase-like protein [Hormoscilla sp. GM7CHS1pb]|nr:HAD hydrolase-like protein [Hormoscilla sp. GM7CHS1pb]
MTVIIFDFDGTLADTLDAIVSITNRLSGEFGYQPASPEDVIQLKNLSSRKVIQQSGLPLWKLPFLLKRVRSEFNNHINELKPVPGIKEVLLELKKRGYHPGILTSNDRKNVQLFTKNHDWEHLFDFIHSEMNLFGKGRAIEHLLSKSKLDRQEVIYVGDETRDIEAAKRTKIRAIAVSWGFNSPEVLAAHNPDFLIHQPEN